MQQPARTHTYCVLPAGSRGVRGEVLGLQEPQHVRHFECLSQFAMHFDFDRAPMAAASDMTTSSSTLPNIEIDCIRLFVFNLNNIFLVIFLSLYILEGSSRAMSTCCCKMCKISIETVRRNPEIDFEQVN